MKPDIYVESNVPVPVLITLDTGIVAVDDRIRNKERLGRYWKKVALSQFWNFSENYFTSVALFKPVKQCFIVLTLVFIAFGIIAETAGNIYVFTIY